MPRPIVAIVGRPNVGKSTLFNRLIGERQAVVHDLPGTTRDRVYGTVEWRGVEFTVADTGGIGPEAKDVFLPEVIEQAKEAIEEADVIVFVVDATTGPLPSDVEVATLLRRTQKPVILAANKAESRRVQLEVTEFYELGLGEPIPVSALNGINVGDLLDAIYDHLPRMTVEPAEVVAFRLAIVGRPNVGKSSLLNAIVGRQRAIVSDVPGTTRDVIDTLISYDGEQVLLIDTAGIRRRGRIERGVEQFSVLRAVRAIERSDIAAVVIDGPDGVTAQDAHIVGYVRDAARGIVLVVNKWDLVPKHARIAAEYTAAVRRALNFVDYAPILFVSALTGQRVDQVLATAREVQSWRLTRIPTSRLNEIVRDAVTAHPLTERGKQLKVYYVTQPGEAPPTFVFFVNDPTILHFTYERFLENRIRAEIPFTGTPIRLIFRGHGE